jgi:hypothetical protein
MSDDREDSIRRRAYELWEQGGGDHGRDQDHWHQATGEVDAAGKAPGTVAPDGTTIGDTGDRGAEGDGGNGASIVEAEVTEPVAPTPSAGKSPAAEKPAAKAPPRPRKPKTTK